jgi:hypothetical protein
MHALCVVDEAVCKQFPAAAKDKSSSMRGFGKTAGL